MMNMKEVLLKLLNTYGATGCEAPVRNVIAEMVKPFADELRVDAMGNLIARKKGAGRRVMLAAHMDQIGFVVTDIDKKGFLRVHNVGGIRRANSINRRVVFANGMSGVLSCEERGNNPVDTSMLKLFIDIGAADKADAEKKVRLGDVAVYAPDVFEMGDFVCGPALDNRAGCAVLIGALAALKNCPNDVTAVFTVQEEVGLRGARAAAFQADPEIGISLDVTLCGDTPKGPRIAVEAGKGIAIKVLDSSLICSPALVRALEQTAEQAGIEYQREVLTAGGNDAAAMQTARAGIPAGTLSIPCRYVHSASEAVRVSDVEDGVQLLAAFLSNPIEL